VSLDLNTYQQRTGETAIYPGSQYLSNEATGLTYVSLGLAGEAGEIANKVKKILRDDAGEVTEEKRRLIAGELGDVLWYVAQVATQLDIDLEEIAQDNLDKLAGRKANGTLQGSGDNR
jgi:NTP pyrophosphatase (non-canonical NTP hydrolase)